MIKIIVCGASGRMGSAIIRIAEESLASKIKIVGKVDVGDDLQNFIESCDALIDFTTPKATLKNLKLMVQHQKPLVIGTTGFTDEEKKQIEAAAQKIPICFSSNMSIGVNVMWKVIAEAAKALGPTYDIEVLEMHHRLKKDSPSGTAMTTAEVLAKATGRHLAEDAIYARHGMIGERKQNEIGIQTLRGGDVVGDHTVYFAGIGERLEITHRATSRDTFAQGALRAAEWLVGKKPGLYDMQDVLGLK